MHGRSMHNRHQSESSEGRLVLMWVPHKLGRPEYVVFVYRVTFTLEATKPRMLSLHVPEAK